MSVVESKDMFLRLDGPLQASLMESAFLVSLNRRLPSLPLPKSFLVWSLSSPTRTTCGRHLVPLVLNLILVVVSFSKRFCSLEEVCMYDFKLLWYNNFTSLLFTCLFLLLYLCGERLWFSGLYWWWIFFEFYILSFFLLFSQIPLCHIWGDIVQSFITKNAVQLE